MKYLLLLAELAVLFSPLIAAVIGHRRDHRRHADNQHVADIQALAAHWADHTPPQPLRAVAWPTRQTPTDLAGAYEPVPWTDPDWALTELLRIIDELKKQDDELAVAA